MADSRFYRSGGGNAPTPEDVLAAEQTPGVDPAAVRWAYARRTNGMKNPRDRAWNHVIDGFWIALGVPGLDEEEKRLLVHTLCEMAQIEGRAHGGTFTFADEDD